VQGVHHAGSATWRSVTWSTAADVPRRPAHHPAVQPRLCFPE